MIDDEGKAGRLARAICADVMLYNAAVKDAPLGERARLISEPLSEGRALYASRVSPRLAAIFDAAVSELVAVPLGLTSSSLSAPQVPREPRLQVQQTSLGEPVLPQSSGGKGLIIAIAVLIVAAVAALVFFRA